MKLKSLLFAVLVLSFFSLDAQVDTAWVRLWDSGQWDEVRDVTTDDSNNVYVAGWSYEWGVNYDFIFAKYDPDGNLQWSKVRNYTSGDKATQILYDPQGYIYVAGFVNGVYSTTGGSFCLMKYTTNGDSVWEYVDVNTYVGQVNAMEMDHAGNIVLAGLEGTLGSMTYMTMKIDPNGNLLWYKTYDNNGPNHNNRINAMAIDALDNVYVTGACDDSATFALDIVTIKYNAQGDSVWLRKFDGPDHESDAGLKIVVNQNNDVYVAGTVFRTNPNHSDWLLMKYDAAGAELWTSYFDYQPAVRSYDAVSDMKLDGSGNIYVSGEVSTTNAQATLRFGLVKFNSSGDTIWTRVWGADGDKNPMKLVLDPYGNSFVVGSYYDGGGTGYNGVTLKYTAGGVFQWEAVYKDSTNLEELLFAATLDGNNELIVAGRKHASLYFDFLTIKYTQGPTGLSPMSFVGTGLGLQCYPNPFAGNTTVEYLLPNAGKVSLRLIDALGHVVPLAEGLAQSSGMHRFSLDAQQMEAGLYRLELIVGSEREQVTVVVVK